jgi:hypothetical protein
MFESGTLFIFGNLEIVAHATKCKLNSALQFGIAAVLSDLLENIYPGGVVCANVVLHLHMGDKYD